MASNHEDGRTVGAVDTAFSIIDKLQEEGACGVTELADAMELPKSTVHKHLQTLVNQGYVRKVDGRYGLGFKFLKYGGTVRDRSRIYTYGRPKVEELAEEVGEMVILSTREGSRGVFLYRANDRYNLREEIPMGTRFYLHQNAAGKAMLAEYEDSYIQELLKETGLPRATENTITDFDALFDRLDTIRERGYSRNRTERDTSVQAVSAAIKDGQYVGAISISVPSNAPAADYLDGKYAMAVQQAASELSLHLEHI